MINVPYYDLTTQYAALRDELLAALDRVGRSAAFVLGEEVARFEDEFATLCAAKHCVALNSGTSALHLALLAAGVGAGDEVITTANTFIATAEAITYTGARPVFVDIDPTTANIDPAAIPPAVTPRTKAIVPVHLYGRPAAMDAILKVAHDNDLPVIEDACQAHGASFQGRPVGTLGLAGVFSFYPSKNLGAYGEGGALVTNDDRVAALARSLRSHGETSRYVHDRVGYNYRMDGFQGAVLRIKLQRLAEWTDRRREITLRYRAWLDGTRVEIPQDREDATSVHHLFVAYVDDRDAVRAALQARGVGTAVHYAIPVHLQKAYAGLGYAPGRLPATERACRRVLSMPLFPEMTSEQIDYAGRTLSEIVGRR